MMVAKRRACIVGLTVLILSSCATKIGPTYQVDFRNIQVPVMLNEQKEPPVGLTVPIVYDPRIRIGSTSDESVDSISSLLMLNIGEDCTKVVLHNIFFKYYYISSVARISEREVAK
jgi:hypothetical protein